MVAPNYQLDQSNKTVIATLGLKQMAGADAQELAEDLRDRIRHDNAQFFVLDMSSVEYIDSACVGTLVEFLQDLEHVRGRVALCGCQPNVEFLFKVTRLDSVIRLYADVEDASEELPLS